MSSSQLSNAYMINAYNSYPVTIDPNYAIIMVYFIGMFVGIMITIDYYKPNKLLNDLEHLKEDIEDEDDEDYIPNEDDEEEDDEQEDDEDKDDEQEYEEQEDDEDYDLNKETVRTTIDIIYIYTDKWEDFVSKKSIYLRLQKIYPTITKFMVKEAMNIEPRYITGSQHNTGGYRYISEL